jgi:hypothetical protein
MRNLIALCLLVLVTACATRPDNLGPRLACGQTQANGWVTLCVMPEGGVLLAGTGLSAAPDFRFGANNPNLKPERSDDPLRLARTERAAYNPHDPLLRIQHPQGLAATNRGSVTGGEAIIITAFRPVPGGLQLLASDGRIFDWRRGGHSVTLVTP